MSETEELSAHWQRYKMEYAAFPTTTHFVERSVKVYNFCSNKSRAEERISQFAICYNIVHDVNQLTKDLMIEAKLEKGQTYKDAGSIKAVGKVKNKTVLQNVFSRHNKIEFAFKTYPILKDVYNDIRDTIRFNQLASFKEECQNNYFDQISDAMEKARKPNKTEIKSGVVFTPALMNQVRFHDAKAGIHNDGFKAELKARGYKGDLNSISKFTELKNELKKLMNEQGETDKENWKEIKFFSIKSNYNWRQKLQRK